MSSFNCKQCGTDIVDTERGYVTECPHYPITVRSNKQCPICGAEVFDAYGKMIHDVNACRDAQRADVESKDTDDKQATLTLNGYTVALDTNPRIVLCDWLKECPKHDGKYIGCRVCGGRTQYAASWQDVITFLQKRLPIPRHSAHQSSTSAG